MTLYVVWPLGGLECSLSRILDAGKTETNMTKARGRVLVSQSALAFEKINHANKPPITASSVGSSKVAHHELYQRWIFDGLRRSYALAVFGESFGLISVHR